MRPLTLNFALLKMAEQVPRPVNVQDGANLDNQEDAAPVEPAAPAGEPAAGEELEVIVTPFAFRISYWCLGPNPTWLP